MYYTAYLDAMERAFKQLESEMQINLMKASEAKEPKSGSYGTIMISEGKSSLNINFGLLEKKTMPFIRASRQPKLRK